MMTYSKMIRYASIFVPHDRTRDLVHDLYIHLNKKGIDLFNVSKRFVYVSIYNLHRNLNYRSIDVRNGYTYSDITDYQISRGANPEQILIAKEFHTTLSDFLRLKVEGYTQEEIGQKLNVSRRWVNKVTNKEIRCLITE